MEFKKITFPNEEFYHFGQSEGAVKISEEWVNQAINSLKEQIKNGEKSPYFYVGSGDTIVIGFFNKYNDEKDSDLDAENSFTILVCRNYYEGEFNIGDLVKKEMAGTPSVNVTLEDIERFCKYKEINEIQIGKFNISINEKEDF